MTKDARGPDTPTIGALLVTLEEGEADDVRDALRSLRVTVQTLSPTCALPEDLKKNLTDRLVSVLEWEDWDDDIWVATAGLLAELGGSHVTSALESFLDAGLKEGITCAVIDALARVGTATTVPRLLAHWADIDHISAADPHFLAHGLYVSENKAYNAVGAIIRRDRAGVVDALMRMLEEPGDVASRRASVNAATLLGTIGDVRAVPLLERVSDERFAGAKREPALREAARFALVKLKSQ